MYVIFLVILRICIAKSYNVTCAFFSICASEVLVVYWLTRTTCIGVMFIGNITGCPNSFSQFGFLDWDPHFVGVLNRPSYFLGAVIETRHCPG